MNNPKLTENEVAKTDLRSLWTDTLIDLLVDAVNHNWSDKVIQDLVKELYNKGYQTEKLMKLLERKLGPEAATKLARFLF